MKKIFHLVTLISATACVSQPAFADDIGSGRDDETPDFMPSEPAPEETSDSILQRLLEWFDMDVEQ